MYNQNELTDDQLQKIKEKSEDFLKQYGNKYPEGTMVKLSESDSIIYSKAGPMFISRHKYLNDEITKYQGFRPEDNSFITGQAITANDGSNSYCHTHSTIYFEDGHGLETFSYGAPGLIHTPIYNIGRYVEKVVDLTKKENSILNPEKTDGDLSSNGSSFENSAEKSFGEDE